MENSDHNLAKFSAFVGRSTILSPHFSLKLKKILLQLPRKKSTQISNPPKL
jgi:hypothetical protein